MGRMMEKDHARNLMGDSKNSSVFRVNVERDRLTVTLDWSHREKKDDGNGQKQAYHV
jgi:hypothetical protein